MGDSCYRKCLKSQGQDSKQERHKISKTVVSGPVAQTASCSISSVLWIAPKIHKYLNYIQGFYPWRLFTHNPSSWPALSPQANCSGRNWRNNDSIHFNLVPFCPCLLGGLLEERQGQSWGDGTLQITKATQMNTKSTWFFLPLVGRINP